MNKEQQQEYYRCKFGDGAKEKYLSPLDGTLQRFLQGQTQKEFIDYLPKAPPTKE